MKRRLHTLLAVGLTLALTATPFGHVSAATFNQNNIINDVVFDNTMTMSASDIDAFLNTFPNSCISSNSGFQAIDPTGYNPTQGFLYGGNVTAGRVIYDAAQAYGLNPQVLLATLQKEEGLVDGSGLYGCSTTALASAVGYGCPDGGASYNYTGVNLYTRNGTTYTSINGTCVNTSSKVGFTQQLIRAAWLFKFGEQRSEGNINWAVIKGSWDNSDDPQSCYSGPMTQGTWQVCPSGASTYYDGYTTIDSTAVHMDDGATAALYWYTPHFSGNQSFFNIFNNWFGSPYTSNIAYQWDLAGKQAYSDSSYSQSFTDGISIAPGQKAYITVLARNFGYETWSQSVVHLGTPESSSVFADPSWLSTNRIQMQESSVLPGSNATFRFSITAPATTGTYTQRFNVVADGVTWLNNPGLYYTIDVVNPRQPSNMQNTGLTAGQAITTGQYLLSPDTQTTLNLQPNGAVILYSDFKPLWSNNVSSSAAQQLVMQGDGNLVEYDINGNPLWASNTNGNTGAYLKLQTDGNLVLFSATGTALWASNTVSVPDHLSRINKILPSGLMYPNQSLDTADSSYHLIMQGDGNLVLYNAAGKPVWASNTDGDGGTNLALQPDGTLVLMSDGGSVMPITSTLHTGQYLVTSNQNYKLIMQGDGNLVLYNAAGKAIWASGTNGSNATTHLFLQSDGNLVIYNGNHQPIWYTNTSGQ